MPRKFSSIAQEELLCSYTVSTHFFISYTRLIYYQRIIKQKFWV